MNASELIDRYIAGLTDWRGSTLSQLRAIIRDTDPEMLEEWKWMGTPTWSHNGIVAIANAHKTKVKVTFAQGANLPDPSNVFNNGLGGNRWRAIDIFEGDQVDEPALRTLIRAAITLNTLKAKDKIRTKSDKPSKKRI
ncbi:MAG: DUF1801 domain-containing protein [Acidimicrobiales bacterium]